MVAIEQGNFMALKIAQVTDCHLFAEAGKTLRGQPVDDNLQSILAMVQRDAPDVLLLTGDLTDAGDSEAYQRLINYVATLECRIVALPGNHDLPEVMQDVFQESKISTEKSLLLNGWHIICLNSAMPNECSGLLAEQELEFLKNALASHTEKPTLIALHHHVLPVQAYIDCMMLNNAEDFLAIIDTAPQVSAVISGHVHQACVTERYGVQFLTAPATSCQFKNQVEFATDEDSVPGYGWLNLNDNGKVTSIVKRLS